jgi:hypothetical protein
MSPLFYPNRRIENSIMALVAEAHVAPLEPLGINDVKEAEFFYMPDLLHNFPWNKGVNKHYAEAKVQSDAWIGSLRRISPKKQAIYNSMDFPFLGAAFCPGYVFHVFPCVFPRFVFNLYTR